MQDKNTRRYDTTAIVIFLLGCSGLVTVIALDKLYFNRGILAEGWPEHSPVYLIRSTVIFISVFALFWGLIDRNRPKLILVENYGIPIERSSILGTLSTSVIFLLLFIFKPWFFNTLSLEDGLIEWGSALLLFSSCIIFVVSVSMCRHNANIPKVTKFTLAFLALVFFIIAMEEISWFQRVIEIETPKILKGHHQDEMNLHNLATNYIENIYYFGAFLFLVILPFMRLIFPHLSDNNYLRLFVARPFIGIIGTVACAYNFDMWNIIFTQISFFSSVVILFAFAIFSGDWHERYLILLTIFIVVSTQVLFLSNGVKFSRLWEVTEYKEFFIPLVFFIYSLDVFNSINQLSLSRNGTLQSFVDLSGG